jgi:hypothetical protein
MVVLPKDGAQQTGREAAMSQICGVHSSTTLRKPPTRDQCADAYTRGQYANANKEEQQVWIKGTFCNVPNMAASSSCPRRNMRPSRWRRCRLCAHAPWPTAPLPMPVTAWQAPHCQPPEKVHTWSVIGDRRSIWNAESKGTVHNNQKNKG